MWEFLFYATVAAAVVGGAFYVYRKYIEPLSEDEDDDDTK